MAHFRSQFIRTVRRLPSPATPAGEVAASDLILFLDGDTWLHPEFPRVACDALSMDVSIAAVWGHRREMHPEQSFFN